MSKVDKTCNGCTGLRYDITNASFPQNPKGTRQLNVLCTKTHINREYQRTIMAVLDRDDIACNADIIQTNKLQLIQPDWCPGKDEAIVKETVFKYPELCNECCHFNIIEIQGLGRRVIESPYISSLPSYRPVCYKDVVNGYAPLDLEWGNNHFIIERPTTCCGAEKGGV